MYQYLFKTSLPISLSNTEMDTGVIICRKHITKNNKLVAGKRLNYFCHRIAPAWHSGLKPNGWHEREIKRPTWPHTYLLASNSGLHPLCLDETSKTRVAHATQIHNWEQNELGPYCSHSSLLCAWEYFPLVSFFFTAPEFIWRTDTFKTILSPEPDCAELKQEDFKTQAPYVA